MVAFDSGYSLGTMEIVHDADWDDTLELLQLNEDGTETALSLENVIRFELFIRPVYDHSVLIKKLSSDLSAGGEIQYSPTVAGQVRFLVPRATHQAEIPIGSWQHFCIAYFADGTNQELWRGPFTKHPGKITA